jgi:hypothetical protein
VPEKEYDAGCPRDRLPAVLLRAGESDSSACRVPLGGSRVVQESEVLVVRDIARLEKLLEDAGIKLSAVVADLLGKSARAMLEAMVAGQRDPQVLADMALRRMKSNGRSWSRH